MLERLKGAPETCNIPVVIVTGQRLDQTARMRLERNAAAILPKDVLAGAEALSIDSAPRCRSLRDMLGCRETGSAVVIKTAKILNVDDHEVNRYIRTQTLEAAGYAVIEASSGTDALRFFEQERPQLVLLDMNLPDIGGREVCRQMRAHPDARSVVVCTYPRRGRARRTGSTGWRLERTGTLSSRSEPELLLATVRSLLRLWTAEAQLEESAAAARQHAAQYRGLLRSHSAHGFHGHTGRQEPVCE